MLSNQTYILQDKKEREIALDCTKSIHCESPAGAGKTSLLTQRYLKLLASSDHPFQILALTFTNKAAGEMRQRIWNALLMAEEGTEIDSNQVVIAKKVLKRHKDNLHLIYSPEGLRIMTFHSLCLAIVRSSPLEAEIPPDISIIEGVEYEEILKQVADETLSRIAALEEGDPKRSSLENRLLRTNNNWSRLRADCINLIKRRDYLKDLIRFVSLHPDMHSLKEMLNKGIGNLINLILEKARTSLLSTDLGKNWKDFAQCLDKINEIPINKVPDNYRRMDLLPDAAWPALSQWQFLADLLTTKEGKARKRFSQDKAFKECLKQTHADEWIRVLPQDVCDILQELKTLPIDGYDDWQIQSIYDLIILMGEIISAWQETCWQMGVIDFVGLEIACLKVFNNIEVPDIRMILDSRINHILIDEFQDTSRNQWDLLQNLCDGWTRGDGRTLFLVGDPKQSIYGFRKAEVSLFIEAKDGLPVSGKGRLPLESITLKHNFRSCPGLVEWTNDIFEKTIMVHPREDLDEVPYSPATASIEGQSELSLALFFQNEMVKDPQITEANWLAHSVMELDRRIDEGETIGILLFARTRIPLYLQAFRDMGFPVMVTEGLLLTDKIEVLSMHQMMKALIRPHDDLAYAVLLRSPWCWCIPDILCMIRNQPSTLWADKIEGFVKSSQGEEIRTWWEIFKRARMRVGRDPLSKVMKNVWLNMDGAYKLANRFGSDSVSNIMRYLDLVDECEMLIPEETLEKVEVALESAYLPSPPEASRSRVTIMTVHKAKGLEFDHVFCPFLDWDPLGGGRFDQPPYLMDTNHYGENIMALKKDQREESQDPVYKLLLSRIDGKRIAESKRIFYVAVTRAKKGLYLSGISLFKNGRLSVRCKDSPLSYLLIHEGIGEWELESHDQEGLWKAGNTDLSVQLNPSSLLEKSSPLRPSVPIPETVPEPVAVSIPEPFPKSITEPVMEAFPESIPESVPKPFPEPFSFKPESILYKVITPSESKSEGFQSYPMEAASSRENIVGKEHVRVKGIIIHRILAALSRGGSLPSKKEIEGALYAEGISSNEADQLAGSILEEVCLCINEKTCSWILKTDHKEAYTEWAVEDNPSNHIIRSGIIDRLIFDGERWWIIDYKTVQQDKNDNKDVFMDQQARLYKIQMESYREMVSCYKGIATDKIVLLLYFTSLQKAYIY
ncbi:MAG: UvrD-helicase domain-containing protein [bacterium]